MEANRTTTKEALETQAIFLVSPLLLSLSLRLSLHTATLFPYAQALETWTKAL